MTGHKKVKEALYICGEHECRADCEVCKQLGFFKESELVAREFYVWGCSHANF